MFCLFNESCVAVFVCDDVRTDEITFKITCVLVERHRDVDDGQA